ncbi:threonine/serine exporter family protein [Microbacterium sp. EYE_5]|uniref:threonine/serine ThrE exporter family protein n=1 Tax=unclassified Microbacterium TaxID=2609290 RepID=UPI002002E238|nr:MULTISPECIES: threonine/serine exporter family protein [unclassified Microbacterium]MCK6080328.1 threonine/serine exporter family protein [Microbacterium sp. EYE_382]MCK6085599.1 threonine/serine exporter family protein [Microbacterium sp. EYE_384]MCK6122176.1 threonine/serine exporter family protein [Microbacterium sp. EYE_80]MCK6126362.1 threonine/serine exporter family protein [Microbacterium sp. EYE_79]MCK6141283.1 threonine/serine exporter family protein [Microbacterium sp. EYE_39]
MRRRRILSSLQSLVRTPEVTSPHTEMIPVIDDAFAVRVLDLAIRIGEAMLAAGAPASEVTLTIVRVAGMFGLDPVHVDVSYNSITVAHHRSGADRPITLMRVVRTQAPDHARLQRLQALVAEIRSGMPIDAARTQFRVVRRTPFAYHPPVVVGAQALLAVGVALMFGANWLVILLTFLAAGATAVTQFLLGRARVPFFFSQIAGAFVLTLIAALAPGLEATGWAAAADIRPSVIVASGIVLMLAGLTVVGAAQDAIDGFALTAMGRILELTTQTLGVVLGILIGLETARVVGAGMDPPNDPLPFGPLPLQFVGAALIAVAVTIYNGAGLRVVVVSVGLSVVAWAGYTASVGLGFDTAAASGVGAFAGSLLGIVAAYRLHVPSVAITTAAILPMVPGAAVFRGLLGVVESGYSTVTLLIGFTTLASAATIGIALAVGASLGIYVGQPLRASLGSVIKARARVRS